MGQPLLTPNEVGLAEAVAEYYPWSPDEVAEKQSKGKAHSDNTSVGMTFAGLTTIDPGILYEQFNDLGLSTDDFWMKANSFRTGMGRSPAFGQILTTYGSYSRISPQAHYPNHSLRLTFGGSVITCNGLLVVSAVSIYAALSNTTRPVHPLTNITDTSPMLLTISDGRYLCERSVSRANYNIRLPGTGIDRDSGRTKDIAWNVPECLTLLAKPLLPFFPGGLKLHESVRQFEQLPVDLSMLGSSSWTAMWALCEVYGLSMRVGYDGALWIFDMSAQQLWNTLPLDALGQGFCLDTKAHQVQPPVAEKITVCCRAEDYQWYTNSQTITPQDAFRHSAVYSYSINATPDTTSRIQPGAEDVIWAPLIAQKNDKNLWINQSVLDGWLKVIAERHQAVSKDVLTWKDWTFAGAWSFQPGPDFTMVSWSDYGDGMLTKLWTSPFPFAPNFSEDTPSWEQQFQSGEPAIMRDGPPLTRWVLADVLPTPNDSMGKDFPTEFVDGQRVLLASISGHLKVTGSGLNFTRRQHFQGFNTTGGKIKVGQRVTAFWNDQIGDGGVWTVMGGGGSGSSLGVFSACAVDLPDRFLADFAGTDGVSRLYVHKGGMLELLQSVNDKNQAINPGSPILSITPGPPDSVLWTAPPGFLGKSEHVTIDPETGEEIKKPDLFWTQDPYTKAITVSHFWRIRPADGRSDLASNSNASSNGVWIGADGHRLIKSSTRNAGIGMGPTAPLHARLPQMPPRSHCYLVSGPTGMISTDLDWWGPGMDATVLMPVTFNCEVNESGCRITPNQFLHLTFENGLLMDYYDERDGSTGKLPPAEGNPLDMVWPDTITENPCIGESVEKGVTATSKDPSNPTFPVPPKWEPPQIPPTVPFDEGNFSPSDLPPPPSQNPPPQILPPLGRPPTTPAVTPAPPPPEPPIKWWV